MTADGRESREWSCIVFEREKEERVKRERKIS